MLLEQLYTNFLSLSPEDQLAFVAGYRARRSIELEIPSKKGKKKSSSKSETSKIVLSDEEKILCTVMGLKPKDILALRSLQSAPAESCDDEDIFKDDTFDLEEEE